MPKPKSFLERLRDFFAGKKTNILDSTKNKIANINSQIAAEKEKFKKFSFFPDAAAHEWDDNSAFFEEDLQYQNEFPAPGIKLIRDAELTFYAVRAGDTISQIRERLFELPEFQYLRRPEYRQKKLGFNIRSKHIQPEMLIPIPLESRERRLTDEQFANYCQKAIRSIRMDPIYSEKMNRILQKFSEKDLTELMIAVAKQESGGKPLGQFEFHRWENGENTRAFSFSIFHIVMRGSGLAARKNLKMTEGQTYHPKNAAKLFLAFLIEKAGRRDAENYLPIGEQKNSARFDQFARFYNGKRWKKYNPNYVRYLKKYLADAHELLNSEVPSHENPTPEDEIRLAKKSSPKIKSAKNEFAKSAPPTFEIGETHLRRAILDANWLALRVSGTNNLRSNKNVAPFVRQILEYLKTKYPKTGTTYFPTDRIGFASGELTFERAGERKIFRLPRISPKEKTARAPKFRNISVSIFRTILNSNSENSKIFGQNILKTNKNALILAQNLEKYLQKIYKNKTSPTDQIAVALDEKGAFLIFRRDKKEATIRI